MADQPTGQLLHLVFGGELSDLDRNEFKDSQGRHRRRLSELRDRLCRLEGKAQQTVDNAQMRYFIVHLHRLLDPEYGYARQGLIPPPVTRPRCGALLHPHSGSAPL